MNAHVIAYHQWLRMCAMSDREWREYRRIAEGPASVRCRAIMRGEWWPL